AADTVSAELQVDPESGLARDVADGGGDIADAVARACPVDRGVEGAAGGGDERLVLRSGRPDDQAGRGVGDPAVHGAGEVEGEQVAVLQPVGAREAVQDGV